MSTSINKNPLEFKSFLANLQPQLRQMVQEMIESQLTQEVDQWLYRGRHTRRHQVSRGGKAICHRCGTRQAKAFSRNGHRQRQLVTTYGVISFRLPRVVCECGGSVRMPFSIVRPYQRVWDDLIDQVKRWAHWGVSLRQMQAAIGEQIKTQMGLRKLNTLVQDITSPPALTLTSVPPLSCWMVFG